MQVEAAERHRVEDGFRQDEAIGDNDRRIRAVRLEGRQRLRRTQTRGRGHREAKTARLALGRRWLWLHAAPSRLGGAGIDRNDLMTTPDDLNQCRHRKVRRAHEDEAKGHWPYHSCATNGLINSRPTLSKSE